MATTKKKKMLALEPEPYERLQSLVKELGWPKNWLAGQVDRLIAGLLIVAAQAKSDAENLQHMTESEAKKRYEDMMRKILEG